MTRKSIFALAALAAFGAIAPLGCKPAGKDGASGAGDAPKSGSSRIVFIPKNMGNPYFEAMEKGFQQASKELGFEFSTTGPAVAEPTAQISYIKDEIQRGATAIVIAANSVDALNGTLDEARAKGIKIITVDSDLTGNETHRDLGVLACDFDTMGDFLIEQMGSIMNYEGKFAILSATTDAPNQNKWIKGMQAAVKNPKYAKMQLVDVVYGDDKDQKSLTEAEALLTKHPDLKGIIAPTTVGVYGCAKAVEQAGVYPGGKNAKGAGVSVIGLGVAKQMQRHLKDGIVPKVFLWDPAEQGYIASYAAVRMAEGKFTPADGATINIPDLPLTKMGDKKVGKNNVLIIGEPVEYNKGNVDKYAGE